MYTETELREALEHSASRAAAPRDELTATPSTRRSWLLPLATAATVAALATGIAVIATDDEKRPAPPATMSTPATSAARTSETPRPVVAIDLVDRAVVGVDAEYTFGPAGDRQIGSQTIRHSLGTGRNDGSMTVDIAPAAAIDASRVERGRRVDIAGTTGWYSALKVYPLDGSTGPGSDKWLPHWTIAFRTPSGDWAFAWIELAIEGGDANLTADDVSVASAAKIVKAYDRLRLQWKDDAARQAFRFATPPAGTTLTSASVSVLNGKIDSEFLTFSRGKDMLVVQLTSSASPLGPVCRIPTNGGTLSQDQCVTPPHRTVAAGTLSVDGSGFDESEQRSVLAGTRVIADPADYIGFEQALTP